MTRTDAQFITQLRQEIIQAQNRRFRYVVAKISFIISLLGLGTIAASETIVKTIGISTGLLLYLIPFVIFVFDLYIVGEDFGIKRAGGFIRNLESASPTERKWENTVHDNRDIFSHAAGAILSGIAFLISAIAIYYYNKPNFIIFGLWVTIGSLLVVFAFAVNYIRDYQLKKNKTQKTAKSCSYLMEKNMSEIEITLPSGKKNKIQYTNDMSKEREFLETLHNGRFTFFMAAIAIVLGGAFNTESALFMKLLLGSGMIISWLIALTLFRSQHKLDIILDKILPLDHPAKIVGEYASGFSMRRIIGYWLPALCSLFITILFVLSYFELLKPMEK